MNPLEEVVTVKEAAQIAATTVRTIQRRIASGQYQARYADGVWLVLKSSVIKEARQDLS